MCHIIIPHPHGCVYSRQNLQAAPTCGQIFAVTDLDVCVSAFMTDVGIQFKLNIANTVIDLINAFSPCPPHTHTYTNIDAFQTSEEIYVIGEVSSLHF